jgi:hypothetical protein
MYGEPEVPGYLSALFAAKPKPDGIWFERNNGDKVRFSEPMAFPLASFSSIYRNLYALGMTPDPGLYTVLVGDNSCRPRPFRVLYFGESGNMNERVTPEHEHYQDWSRAAGGAENLRVAYYFLFGSTKDERVSIESDLIKYYSPQCNVTFNPFASSPFSRSPVAVPLFGAPPKRTFPLAVSPFAEFVPGGKGSFKGIAEPDHLAEVARLLFGDSKYKG